jgi:hypothetical protein
MALVLDDQLLLRVLGDAAPQSMVADLEVQALYTTSCWYYRLARAVLYGPGRGALTRLAEALSPDGKGRLRASLRRLPDDVTLVGTRLTIPTMAELRLHREVNMLSAEALAVASLADAAIALSTASPGIEAGAAQLGIPVRIWG